MKFIIQLILLTAMGIAPTVAWAQPDYSDMSQNEISKFSFFVGEWKGNGTSYSPDGHSKFLVEESIRFDVDSTVLHIEGLGIDVNTGERGHDALAVLYYDHQSRAIKLHSFIMNGANTIANVELTGTMSFKWYFDTPNGGKMTFNADFTNDTWDEVGEYTTPDGKTFKTIEMTLGRVK